MTRKNLILVIFATVALILAACGGAGYRGATQPDGDQPPPDEGAATQPEQPPAQEEAPTEIPPTEPPPPPTPVVFEATDGTAESLADAWAGAYSSPLGIPFSVTFTEAEIEAHINQAVAASGYGENISELDVILDNGQIGLTFGLELEQADRSLSATVIFAVALDANGKITVSIVSAEAQGAVREVEIPPEMLTVLNDAVAVALSGADVSEQADVDVMFTELIISGGAVTISGYVTSV